MKEKCHKNFKNLASNWNWTRTQNLSVLKRRLNHIVNIPSLVKWLSIRLQTNYNVVDLGLTLVTTNFQR